MSHRFPQLRPAAVAALLLFLGLLSCGREVTGPGGRGLPGEVALNPVFSSVRLEGTGEMLSIGSVVDFTKVRVVLVRLNGDTVVDRLVAFPPESTTVRLTFQVLLGEAATSQGEPLSATMKYINAAGDTVFSGGPVQVFAKPTTNSATLPPDILLTYTGPGANATGITISPRAFTGTINQQATFTAVVTDATQTPITSAPVAYTSTDSARVRVNLRSGVATLVGARGTASIIAQTLTGQADTALVSITPTASAIVLVSGGNQQTRQGTAFPLPVRVRVNAADGLGVSGVAVQFAVLSGQGSIVPGVDTTDVSGFAQAVWTAGDSAGTAILSATVAGTQITLTVSGQQLSSAASSLAFSASPVNFTAGDTIPKFDVRVLDATGAVVSGFSGNVQLALTGGTAGANLIGSTLVAAVNGVASFSGLTVDRAGTGYRIVASSPGVPQAQSATFSVAAAPPTAIVVVRGANQTAPASTALPDSVVVRVTNTFGNPVAGLTVQWTVAAGGGTVSPASAVTDTGGRAATRWTIGAAGIQQITATAGALQPIPISATVFVGQGTPALFMGVDQVATTVTGVRSVPVFVSPAPSVALVAGLVMRDTSIAAWTADSVVFTAGSTLRSPTLVGRAIGSTYAVATSSAGTDSVLVTVDSAFVRLIGNGYNYVYRGDTLRYYVQLTEPAPVGGITVTAVSDNPTALLVSPGSGRGEPACDYCYDLRADAVPSILAPPAETAFVAIPEGQTVGQLVVFPVDTSLGGGSVSISAPGFASGSVFFSVSEPTVYLYSGYNGFGVPFPVGSRNDFYVSLNQPLRHDVTFRFTSRNPAVARVDSLRTVPANSYGSSTVYYDGLTAGSTWIVVDGMGLPTDSLEVVVTAPYVSFDYRTPFVTVGGATPLQVWTSTDSTGLGYYGSPPRTSDFPFTLSSSDPSVMVADFGLSVIRTGEQYREISVRGLRVGTAWLRVTSPGAGSDSALVTVSAATLSIYESYPSVGTGEFHESMFLQLYGGAGPNPAATALDVTSSDPFIARVLTPQLNIGTDGYSQSVRILGVAPGRVTITFSGPGIDTVTQVFDVVTPVLMLNAFGAATNLTADSAQYDVLAATLGGFNVARSVADTLLATLRSTNPAAILVTDSVVRFAPGFSANSTGGRVRVVGPGSAQLTLSAPGWTPDTTGVITVLPYRLELPVGTLQAGVNLEHPITVFRRAPSTGALPFTVAVQGPNGSTPKAASDVIAAGTVSKTFGVLVGSVAGRDTVIVSTPGYQSDTVFLQGNASRAQLSLVSSGIVGQENVVSALLRSVFIAGARAPNSAVALALRSGDSTIVRVTADTIRFVPGSTQPSVTGLIGLLRPGTAYLYLTDPSGRFAPDSVPITVQRQSLWGRNEIFMSMREQSAPYEFYVYRDYSIQDSVWVRFTSSAPSLVTVTDSALIPSYSSYAYFTVTSADTMGGAIITASAPGYADVRMAVNVTRGRAETYVNDYEISNGGRTTAYAYLVNTYDYGTHRNLDTIPLRIRSEDPGVATIGADSLVMIPPTDYGYTSGLGPIIGAALGVSGIVVEDARDGAFQQYLPGHDEITVVPSVLTANSRTYALGVGLSTAPNSNYVSSRFGGDSTWVQVRSVGGRVAFDVDSVLIDNYYSYYGYFTPRGLSAGTDTLVFSAPGYTPDSVVAVVGSGMLNTYGQIPPTIVVGDSVLVTVSIYGPDGSTGYNTDAARTLTLSVTGPLQTLSAATGLPASTVNVPIGATSLSFWVKATAAGGGEFTVSGPDLLSFRRVVDTRVRP